MHLRQRHSTPIRTRGKRAPWSARADSLLSLLPLLPDQKTVRQHYAHRVPVKARPQPSLILVPAQQTFGLFVILLHPMPTMRVLYHPLQRYLRTEVAPVVPPLAVGGILTDQPARTTMPRGRHAPATLPDKAPAHPALASLPPGYRAPRPRRLRPHQDVGPSRRPAAPRQRHGEVGADGDHVVLSALLQAVQEVGVVAVVGVGGHAGAANAPIPSPVKKIQGDLRLGLEDDFLGYFRLRATVGVVGPGLGQVESCGDRPGNGALGVVAVDRDLAVADLTQGTGVLACDADGAATLLGKAGVVEDQDAIALGGQAEHALDALPVEVVLVPVDGRQKALEALLGGPRDDLGDGVAVLVGVLGEQPGEVALQCLGSLAPVEVDTEGGEELGQLGQWSARGVWDSSRFHALTTNLTNQSSVSKVVLTFPTKLNTRPHSSEDVNGNIDDLGPVKPLGTASCSRSYVFLLFSRDYHSGLLSVTSVLRKNP